jgi:hypothetical protein
VCARGAEIIDYLHIELFDHNVFTRKARPLKHFGSSREARDHFDNFYEYYRLYGKETAHPPYAPLLWGQSRLERAIQRHRSKRSGANEAFAQRARVLDRPTHYARSDSRAPIAPPTTKRGRGMACNVSRSKK